MAFLQQHSQLKTQIQKQKTLTKKVSLSGIGIHSARLVDISIAPAPADTGITFKRTDIAEINTEIKACASNVADTMYNSRIMNEDGVAIGTIEHLMAAFAGMGIDNAYVEVNATELPAMDGSAEPYCKMILEAGITTLNAQKKYIKVLKPIQIHHNSSSVSIYPSQQLEINITIDFDDPLIGHSQYFYIHDPQSFTNEISQARTFCLSKDLTKMRAAGYGLGGSLDNTVVVEDGKLLNEQGLRFTDEFVRHKTLDCIGDLYLSGLQILGRFHFTRPGHTINNQALNAILSDNTAWEVVSAENNHYSPSHLINKEPVTAFA